MWRLVVCRVEDSSVCFSMYGFSTLSRNFIGPPHSPARASAMRRKNVDDDCSDRESAGENVSVVRRFRGSKFSVYNHLLASPDCCNSYSDSSFTVLCRGRHGMDYS